MSDPIPMLLFCPDCTTQHIDEPHGDWTNPPHRSHECQHCGHIWRPADVPTTGVRELQTRGACDNSPVPRPYRLAQKSALSKAEWHEIYSCLDCKKLCGVVVFKNEVWKQINPRGKGWICLACVEKRLGRRITENDLMPVDRAKCNDILFYLLKERARELPPSEEDLRQATQPS
jgi:hypothetical protein